jgi:5-methylcytosine-specific restriction endonuclease McrA
MPMTLECLLEWLAFREGSIASRDSQPYVSTPSGLTEEVREAIRIHKKALCEIADMCERGTEQMRKRDESRPRRRDSNGMTAQQRKYAAYLHTDHWKQVRSNALERAVYQCQLCKGSNRLAVHHNNYWCIGKETERDVIVLCDMCHKKHHFPDREVHNPR